MGQNKTHPFSENTVGKYTENTAECLKKYVLEQIVQYERFATKEQVSAYDICWIA